LFEKDKKIKNIIKRKKKVNIDKKVLIDNIHNKLKELKINIKN